MAVFELVLALLLGGVGLALLAPRLGMPWPALLALAGAALAFVPSVPEAALGLSAVLTIVAYAVTLARSAPERMSARHRRTSYAVWKVAVFVLNVLAFILVGLQLRGILRRLDGPAGRYALFAAAVLAAAVLVRVAWVMGYYAAARWTERRFGVRTRRPIAPPTVQGGVVIAWCGMRGIVTLAAALALPAGFPERDLILFASHCVVLGTLVIQGLTLRPLLSRLALPQDESVEEEVALARAETAGAALEALGADADQAGEARHLLKREYQARLNACARPGSGAADPTGLGALRRRALATERARLAALRREERIGDDAFHRVEEELDWMEAKVDGSGR